MRHVLYMVTSLIWFTIAVISLSIVFVASLIRATSKRLVSWVKPYALRDLNDR